MLAGLLLLLSLGALFYLRGNAHDTRWVTPPSRFPVISSRGSFDMDGKLLPGKGLESLTVEGDLMVSRGPDEPSDMLVVIHGFNNSAEKARYKFGVAEEGLRQAGYAGVIAGYSWDSDRQRDPLALTGYRAARRVAVGNGPLLAAMLAQYQRAVPECRLHLIGYSMGARLALETLLVLDTDPQYAGLRLSSVHLVGAAVDNDEAELDGPYGRAIEQRCEKFFNYYSPEDDKLGAFYWPKEADRALGETGIEHASRAPANYLDVDVTQQLRSYDKADLPEEGEEGDNHSGYLGNRAADGRLLDDGVMDLVAANIAALPR